MRIANTKNRSDILDILQEIKSEHDEFRSLITEIENASDSKKKSLFNELNIKIHAHHEAEETVLFPDVKSKSDEEGKDVVMEMIEEHNLGAYQLSLLDRTSIENETWDAKFSVLKEVLTHHMDEEEKELFQQAREVLTKAELKEKYEPFEEKNDEEKKKMESKMK
jgi:hemerythrin-like domain-containing protein